MAKGFLLAFAIWTTVCCSLALADQFTQVFGFGGPQTETFFCRRPPPKTVKITGAFPDVFSVSIEAVQSVNGSTPRISDVVESYDKTKSISAITRFEDGIQYQYIFNQTSKTFSFVNDATSCTDGMQYQPYQTSNLTQNDPLLFPNNVNQYWWNNVSSIADIWTWATKDTSEIFPAEEEHGHDHGIPVDHYFVCKKGPGDYVFEVEICVTQSGVKLPFAGFNNGSFPVRIDVKFYRNLTDQNATISVEQFVGYRLSSYKTMCEKEREKAFLPPPGVPCNIASQSRPQLPAVPNSFSVSVEYLDEQKHTIAVNQLCVDSERHYLSLQYSHNETGLPMPADHRAPRGKIIHDFNFGMEYMIDSLGDTCINVTDLPNDASDIEMEDDKGKRSIIMKNSSELLGLHLEHGTVFYYVGERFLDDDIPTDVWLSYGHDNQTGQMVTTVHEAYFSKPNWQSYTSVGSSQQPVLLAVKIYTWPSTEGPKSPPVVKTLRYRDFITYPKPGVPWKSFDVTPCLSVSKNDSYLVAFGNDTLTNVDKMGRSEVEDALRKAIADGAGVSPLRVTNFYFEAVNDSFWVFFFIADRPSVNGTKTKWYGNEPISAKDARLKLNATITDKPMSIPVYLDDSRIYYVALNKNSLSAVPPYFSTPIIHNETKGSGYTGGSMAALGICMLLIGGVLGMVLAFFMWKRNRAGGGAPVYYSNKSSA